MAIKFDDKVVIITGAGGGLRTSKLKDPVAHHIAVYFLHVSKLCIYNSFFLLKIPEKNKKSINFGLEAYEKKLGLGKCYAINFAARGAKVVVNDLGGSSMGEGKSSMAADAVVKEIIYKGGIAVADYNSVEHGDKIIQTALDNFGRIDILVNNAGIIRDKSFLKISDHDWDLVHNVHLRGSFIVTRAAFAHMKKQRYGRIIVTASGSGIYGNFGQANYSAAKMGLIGLSNTVAIEGRNYDINCNAIAPIGATRLTQGILPPDLLDELKPEQISAIVLWLCHKDCEETGGIFGAAGGWFGQYRFQRSSGSICRDAATSYATPELVRRDWSKIKSFDDASALDSFEEDCVAVANSIEQFKTNPASNSMNSGTDATKIVSSQKSSHSASPAKLPNSISTGPLSAIGVERKNVPFAYTSKDVILYALGVGASARNNADLRFLYEASEDFTCLPTFPIVPSQIFLQTDFLFSLPGWNIDFSKVLHGEQFVEVFKAFPTSGTVFCDFLISDVLDKGSGALIVLEVSIFDENKILLAKTQWSLFVVGSGGFQGKRNSDILVPVADAPKRDPDVVKSFIIPYEMAALYRLSGDFNPLHIDKNFSQLAGFEEPILHGLCSYGIASKIVLASFCDNNPSLVQSIKARFTKPVTPGQTLEISMWEEVSRIHFQAVVKETGETCLTGGYLDLYPGETARKISKSAEKLRNSISTIEDMSKMVPWNRGIFHLEISVNGKIVSDWTIDFTKRPKILKEGKPKESPNSTLTIDDLALLSILNGKSNFKKCFLNESLKVEGHYPPLSVFDSVFGFASKL